MKNNKTKPLKINETLHREIKDFCDKRGFKIYKWVEKVLLQELNKEKLNDKKSSVE